MNLDNFIWRNEPKAFELTKDGKLYVTTKPNTDYWQRNEINDCKPRDNGHAFLKEVEELEFTFSVKVDFDYKKLYDQCGVIVYIDTYNWFKVSIEYENEEFYHLGSVHATKGYSDWACTEVPSDCVSMYYRLSRKGYDFRVESSVDGVTFKHMRTFHLFEGKGTIKLGVYACSPKESSFNCAFSEWNFGKCIF